MAEILRNLKGIRKLMVAPLTTDTEETLAYATPVRLAGVKEVGGEAEESTGTEYYDNQASISTTAEGVDTYNMTTSVLEDEVRAVVEGRKADTDKGIYYGSPLNRPYIAVGFISEDTNGQEWYNWIYKGKLTGGKEKHQTKDDGTETTNLEWEYASIYTQHKFKNADNKSLKFIRVKAGGDITEEQFFASVYDPDKTQTAQAKAK